jgi:hypothetical protein
MRDHACCSPTDRRRIRRKGIATIEELALSVAGERALALGHVLRGGRSQVGAQSSLSDEISGFLFVRVVSGVANQIEPPTHTNEGRHSCG